MAKVRGTAAVRMPVVFAGHGSPMNAIEDNAFSRAWAELGESLPRPKAILCISAHWQTTGTWVTAMPIPKMIYDFIGFPAELYQVLYPAPGAPEWAQVTRKTIQSARVGLDTDWGLDHGAWSVLCRMFPQADVPVFQLSLDQTQPPFYHYALGRELAPLREQGILIVGSGNVVHNLGLTQWEDTAFDWAVEFDRTIKALIEKHDHAALIDYGSLGKTAELAIPTNEHYLPLLYTLALQDRDEPVRFFAEQVTLGSISMRGMVVGG